MQIFNESLIHINYCTTHMPPIFLTPILSFVDPFFFFFFSDPYYPKWKQNEAGSIIGNTIALVIQ